VYTVKNTGQGTGDDFYVHHTGSGDGFNPDQPVSGIDAAIALCAASKGDTIHVMEGHAETLSGAAAIACDVAGITIQGHGRGTDRPQITLDNTAATITVTAANVTIRNIHFLNGVDALVVGIPVTAAHCLIEDCLFDDPSTLNTLHWITLSAAADYFELVNCENAGTDTAGNTGFITMAAADHVKIIHLVSHGDFAAANIDASAAPTNILIEDCVLENANAVDVNIEMFAAATGWIRYCSLTIPTDGEVTWINTPGALALFENYGVNDDGETGMIVGTVSTT
jgi:hypothetical protein|tara:strand:+ start:3041 stop:3886 length:846 start_codon:yes stop_codon:yes gene_type:complete